MRGGADAELELLGGRGEASGLVGAEAVLAGQDHGEAPAGAGLAAELAQVPDRSARWRFAAGSARSAVFPPGGNRVAAAVTGALAVAATTAAALGGR